MDCCQDDRDNDGGIEWWQTFGQQQEHELIDLGQSRATKMASEPLPGGMHVARLVHIVELGTQKTTYADQTKLQKKIRLAWELPFEKDDQGQPRMIGMTYTSSMHPDSTLRKHLTGWRGKGYTDVEIRNFDIKQALGRPCTLITLQKTVGDKTYTNIDAITAVQKGAEVPDQVNTSLYLAFDEYSAEAFDSLPGWLQETIAKSPEYASLNKKQPALASLDDEDVPF